MKRIPPLRLPVVFLAVLLLSAIPLFSVSAYDDISRANALQLNYMGVFRGGNGDPLEGLDQTALREQAAVMLVRMLGEEENTMRLNLSNPFTDAQKWQKPYISWLYEQGLTNGMTADFFGAAISCDMRMYCTFMLRTLGYSEEQGDFTYSEAVDFLKQRVPAAQLTRMSEPGLWGRPGAEMKRSDMADLTIMALSTNCKGREAYTLADALVDKGVFTVAQAIGLAPGHGSVITEQTPDIPATDAPKGEADTREISVSGSALRMDMTVSQLTNAFGLPSERLASEFGGDWYVYTGGGTYGNFFMVSVENNRIEAIYCNGNNFSFEGITPRSRGNNSNAVLFADSNDGGKVYAVLLQSQSAGSLDRAALSAAAYLRAMEKLDFHLVNASRAQYGLSVLRWNDKVADVARSHSADMSARNYFDHASPEGKRPGDRLNANSMAWSGYAENISLGYTAAIDVHNGWMNSSGHRNNILNTSIPEMGVGVYGVYATELYYRP
jgi:hypothetical protein